jgi:type II secretory pathway pseudopilin PulG
MISMTIILIVLGLVMTLFARSLGTRQRESSRTDALTAAQAALNVISREIANSGYGLKLEADGIADNGLVDTDSDSETIHFRANTTNDNIDLTDTGEDVTYYYEPGTQSILRYDQNGGGPGEPLTSIMINRISSLSFEYFDYSGSNPVPTIDDTPTAQTGRVRVTVSVKLETVLGQANPQDVILVSDVTLRNSEYMLQQY